MSVGTDCLGKASLFHSESKAVDTVYDFMGFQIHTFLGFGDVKVNYELGKTFLHAFY